MLGLFFLSSFLFQIAIDFSLAILISRLSKISPFFPLAISLSAGPTCSKSKRCPNSCEVALNSLTVVKSATRAEFIPIRAIPLMLLRLLVKNTFIFELS